MLPSGARLRRAGEFRATYDGGRAYPDALAVLHVQALSDRPDICQVGFSVGKKVGNSVVRNRVKRRLRAIVARLLPEIAPGHRIILRARSRAAEADFEALEKAVTRLFDRASLRPRSVVDKAETAP